MTIGDLTIEPGELFTPEVAARLGMFPYDSLVRRREESPFDDATPLYRKIGCEPKLEIVVNEACVIVEINTRR